MQREELRFDTTFVETIDEAFTLDEAYIDESS